MQVAHLVVGVFGANCYLLETGEKGPLIVIDPGDDAREIAKAVESRGGRVLAYLLTHGHVDHVSALADLHRAFPAPVHMHPGDGSWAFKPLNALPPYYGAPEAPGGTILPVGEGDLLDLGGIPMQVLHTPGHSPGGVCFYLEAAGVLFTGDTLFRESVGRTDLPGGDSRVLGRSLEKLLVLPSGTVVYPGHGPATSIGHERERNPFLTGRYL